MPYELLSFRWTPLIPSFTTPQLLLDLSLQLSNRADVEDDSYHRDCETDGLDQNQLEVKYELSLEIQRDEEYGDKG